jgi:hypothetical protein
MNQKSELSFTPAEQAEIVKQAKLAVEPQIGGTKWWQEFRDHMAVLEGRGMVEPRAAKKD